VERALRYLGSLKNIAGCGLALVGLALHFAGLLGPFWPAVVPALYLIGALVAPSGRPAVGVAVDPFDPDRIQRALDGTYDMARGRLPADVQARIGDIRRRIVELLPHASDLPGGAADLYVLQRTAREYLPTTVRIYLALPPDYATTRVVQDGKTSLDILRDQLELLDAQMAEIADAVHQRDSDRLLAQGRFLEERFGSQSSELTLPRRP
jgi:hypothetical protein